jgi:hypothetical protein
MRSFVVFAIAIFVAFLSTAQAQEKAKPNADFVLSPIKFTSLKETPFMYVTEQVTQDTIVDVIEKRMGEMHQAMKDGGFQPAGPPVFVFHNSGLDRKAPFKLDVGFPVAPDAVAAGDYQLGKLESKFSAVTVFVGSTRALGQAYRRLYEQLIMDGHVPSGDRRERYLYFEDADSTNNVILIEIQLLN